MKNLLFYGPNFFNVDYLLKGTFVAELDDRPAELILVFAVRHQRRSKFMSPYDMRFEGELAKAIHKSLRDYGFEIPIKKRNGS